MSQIFTIAYRSRNLIEEQTMDSSAEMQRLLEQARARNMQLGVTGALLFNEGRFVQILEGEQDNVLDVLRSIVQDKRHTDVDILPARVVPVRTFDKWSMAYVGITHAAREYYDAFSLARHLEWTESSAEALGRLLLDLIMLESSKMPVAAAKPEERT